MKKDYKKIFIENLNDYNKQKMEEVKEIRKIKIYKKRLKEGFFFTFFLRFVIFFLYFYKDNTFINYIFRFILVANGILFLMSAYIFLLTLLKSIEIVKISKEFELKEKNINNIFKL
jgi:sensor histidine kinase YesM